MFRYWWLDNKVAFSMAPPETELDDLAGVFKAVVVLVDEFELPYSLNEWRERGVEVLHSPTPDFSAPSLSQLLETLIWIDGKVKAEKKVLVHCTGGCGRSGTVGVAWLMYSRGLSLREALSTVRKLRPCAVETEDQMRVLRELEKALRIR